MLDSVVPFLVDILALAVVSLTVALEARRGLFWALADVLRILLALVLGLAAYSLGHRLTSSYEVGFVALAVVTLLVVVLIPLALRLLKLDPAWGRSGAGRIGGGLIGAGIGIVIVLSFAVVGHQMRGLGPAIGGSWSGAAALDASPVFYYLADAFDIDMPMLNRRARRFEDEGSLERATLVDRINYSRFDGATCIECRGRVRFAGYHRRFAVAVSPRFVCRRCGRTSDGCQTFEAFHRMYGRCPVEVAARLGPIDCGVWPNDRPVYPNGTCPVCGRALVR